MAQSPPANCSTDTAAAERRNWRPTAADRDQLRRQVWRARRRAGPDVSREDLEQVALIALFDAHCRWRPDGGASRETFAQCRIDGAMLDELRQEDPMPRRQRELRKRARVAAHRLQGQLCRPPRLGELAAELGLAIGDLAAAMLPPLVVASEDYANALTVSNDFAPHRALAAKRAWQAVCGSGVDLSLIWIRYCCDYGAQGDLARELGVSESRVSQRATAAAEQVRALLQEHMLDETELQPNCSRALLQDTEGDEE